MALMTWIIIGTLIILAVVLLKFKEIRHRISLFGLIFLLLLLILSFSLVSRSNDVDLTTLEGVISISKIYFSWLINVGKNLFTITGNAVKQDWGVNGTNISAIIQGR